MTSPRLSILVLCDYDRGQAGNLREHLEALKRHSRHHVRLYNARGVPRSRFLDLDAFDVVVIHYSIVITSDNYLAPWLREKIRTFKGLKVQFLQDEYRWVDAVTAMMRWLAIDVLFSIVPTRSIPLVYGGRLDGIEIVPTLAGFVPERSSRIKYLPPSRRPIDVGYRGRSLPYWIGSLSQEKVAIARGFLQRVEKYGLGCDIAWSEADRIYGNDWFRFLASCRTTLGTESGASITDFDGSIEDATLVYLKQHPDASFEQVFDAVLEPYEGNVMMNVISPRIFEAAAMRTALVLFPGHYGGVLEPERHYIPLEKNFSNMDTVVSAIRDDRMLAELTDRTYAEVVASGAYSLRAFVSDFDSVVDRRARRRSTMPRASFIAARLERPLVTHSIGGVDLIEAREASRRRRIALRFIREIPELRALAGAYLADRELRTRYGKMRALEDALRLGLLLREQAGRPAARDPFCVVPVSEEPGVLTLTSVPPPEHGSEQRDELLGSSSTSRALDLLQLPEFPTLLWNHTQIGALVFLRRPGKSDVGLQVGYHRMIGVYRFGVVEALAHRHREAVLAALRSLIAPASPLREPEPSSRSGRQRLLQHRLPGGWFRRARVAGAALATHRGRAFLVLYARDRGVDPQALVAELVKLDALASAAAGRIAGVTEVAVEVADGTLTYVSNGRTSPDLPQAPVRIRWDHSAVGTTISYRGLTLSLGVDGVYEFAVLGRLLRHPEHSWQTLLPANAPGAVAAGNSGRGTSKT